MNPISEPASVVLVVDPDAFVRLKIKRLVRSVGIGARLFGSAEEFLRNALPNVPSCLVLDVRLPGISGLELQRQLALSGAHIPFIFVTAYGDIPMATQALKAGAADFFTKPSRDQDLLDAIQMSLERDRIRRALETEMAALRGRFQSLTQREREVVALAVSGMLNKQIGARIGIAENTVKVHRSRGMRKMEARSFAHLVGMVGRISTTLPQVA